MHCLLQTCHKCGVGPPSELQELIQKLAAKASPNASWNISMVCPVQLHVLTFPMSVHMKGQTFICIFQGPLAAGSILASSPLAPCSMLKALVASMVKKASPCVLGAQLSMLNNAPRSRYAGIMPCIG